MAAEERTWWQRYRVRVAAAAGVLLFATAGAFWMNRSPVVCRHCVLVSKDGRYGTESRAQEGIRCTDRWGADAGPITVHSRDHSLPYLDIYEECSAPVPGPEQHLM